MALSLGAISGALALEMIDRHSREGLVGAMTAGRMMKVLREPFVQFFVIGAALFAAYAVLNHNQNEFKSSQPQIHVGQGEVRWLTETWMLQYQRPPTREELQTLVREFINEELLVREAREMRLDESDTIVRRRLAQKVNFLIEGALRRSEPTDSDLQKFYAANPELFRTEARISFTHVYFSPATRADPISDAKKVLADLSEAKADEQEAGGDRFLLGSEFLDENEQSVVGAFGQELARALFDLKPAVWSGPIRSGFGVHLVRVSALEQSRVRTFAEARAEIVREWHHDRERAEKKRYLSELQKKYKVIVEDDVKPLLVQASAMPRALP